MQRSLIVFILLLSAIQQAAAYDNGNDSVIVRDISIQGNKRTKDKVILREISFKKGDTLRIESITGLKQQSINYLMNTALFHEAVITDSVGGEYLYISIEVRERWYIIPEPNFELSDRNFNAWWVDKDWRRTTVSLETTHHNFRGLNQKLTLDLSAGWRDKIGLAYAVPYLNRHGTIGMGLAAVYAQGHEVGYNTLGNKLYYFRFGDRLLLRQYAVEGSLSFRPRLKSTHYFRAGHTYTSVDDTVAKLNPELLGYGRTSTHIPRFTYQYVYNTRDQQFYPLKGRYIVASAQQSGVPVLADDVNILTLDLTYHHFLKLFSNTFAAVGFKTQHNFADYIPYLYRSSLGYSFLVRGYEYHVMDGQTLLLMNTELKYKLLDREFHLRFIPFEQFNRVPLRIFLKGLFDAAYVSYPSIPNQNTLLNKPLAGWGAGIDITSYYDRILRIEYSFNNTGGQNIYLHLVEVF